MSVAGSAVGRAAAMLTEVYGGRAMGMTRKDLLRTFGTVVTLDGSQQSVHGLVVG